MTLFEDIEKMQKQIQKRLEDEGEKVGEKIGENPAAKPIGGNAYAVSSSELFKHDNWSAGFHIFENQRRAIVSAFSIVKPEKLKAYLEEIVEKGQLPKNPVLKDEEGVIYDGKNKMAIHPDIVEILKEELEALK